MDSSLVGWSVSFKVPTQDSPPSGERCIELIEDLLALCRELGITIRHLDCGRAAVEYWAVGSIGGAGEGLNVFLTDDRYIAAERIVSASLRSKPSRA